MSYESSLTRNPLPAVDYDRVRLHLARRCMEDFATYTDPLYRMNWHHRAICRELDNYVARQTKRLMIFTAPRHGKSELGSRKLPPFIFGNYPDAQVITTSYSADLAQRMNRDAQRIMDSDAYGKVFPATALMGSERVIPDGIYQRNSDIFEIVNHRGIYRCAGVGGGITGMGGDYIIIDDPIKNREEANSPVYRQKIWDWYTSTLYTRLQKDGCILLIVTRWHEDDLAGRLLEQEGDAWRVIELPAICEEPGLHDYDIRTKDGEALWPEEYSAEALAATKRTVGSYDWASLYQQHPSPGEGGVFKRQWWQYYETPPAKLFDYIQSWDCAFKDTETSDYVVGQVWARDQKNPADRYLLDQVRDRMNFTETLQAIRTLSAKWPKCSRKLVEDKANGTAVIQVLKREIPGLVPVNPVGGKVVRANAVTAAVQAGNVYIPSTKKAAWAGDFIEEHSNFPNGKHDDQVDCTTQANAYYNDGSNFNIRNLNS